MKIEVNKFNEKVREKRSTEKYFVSIKWTKNYGLLGRNGAGKTTFMDILAGHNLHTSGEDYDQWKKSIR